MSQKKPTRISKDANTLPASSQFAVDKKNESAATDGVTKHYFKRYYNFENLLMGTTMRQRVNDNLGETLRTGTHGGRLVP